MMLIPALISICLASTNAAPSSRYVVHQKSGSSLAAQWVEKNIALDKTSTIPLSIGLTQQNLDQGESYLMDVSDPKSANYGKHWTPDQVATKFGATDATIAAVKSWLASSGISEDRSTLSHGRNWINLQVTISEAEDLLKTQYKVFQNAVTSTNSLACEEYSVPQDIQAYIDMITPTVAKTPMTRVTHQKNQRAASIAIQERPTGLTTRDSSIGGASNASWDISQCPSGLTRACAQALYNIPNNTLSSSSYAVVEYLNQAYIQNDLELYMYELVSKPDFKEEPTIITMPDTVFLGSNTSEFGEGNLDVQIAAGLTYPQPLTYYQIGQDDIFLDAVDANYCSQTNTTNSTLCGTTPLASVVSVSWGSAEGSSQSDVVYQSRLCNEYLKLGLLGTTLLFSSGDSGVGSDCTTFVPQFPASCPWVTTVGATKINGTLENKEIAVEYFASGGGFSNVFPIPSYQKDDVTNFLQNHTPDIDSSLYNSTGTSRAYPDISANGDGYTIVMNGTFTNIGGTSQSAPLLGSIISLINEQRIAKGKSTVGFINPVLYANQDSLNDVVYGSNPGCKSTGFNATEGWDPVTGLGTVDYERLLEVFSGYQ